MNGPIAFARTIRALDADTFRISNVALLLVAALLTCWTWWMFAAKIPRYETTQKVVLDRGRAIATFPPRVLEHMRPGQPATVTLDDAVLQARVLTIATDLSDNQVHAVLSLTSNRPSRIQNPHKAEASVATDQVSPATLLMRALGRANR